MNFVMVGCSSSCSDIRVKFRWTEATVKENENRVTVVVVREASGARNIKEFKLRIHEDPTGGGCLSNSKCFATFNIIAVPIL